jgi:hypothetical protein
VRGARATGGPHAASNNLCTREHNSWLANSTNALSALCFALARSLRSLKSHATLHTISCKRQQRSLKHMLPACVAPRQQLPLERSQGTATCVCHTHTHMHTRYACTTMRIVHAHAHAHARERHALTTPFQTTKLGSRDHTHTLSRARAHASGGALIQQATATWLPDAITASCRHRDCSTHPAGARLPATHRHLCQRQDRSPTSTGTHETRSPGQSRCQRRPRQQHKAMTSISTPRGEQHSRAGTAAYHRDAWSGTTLHIHASAAEVTDVTRISRDVWLPQTS